MSDLRTVRTPTQCCIFVTLLLLPYAESSIQFISPYGGKTVKGLVGSSVNFTWSFSGNSGHAVYLATWGLPSDNLQSIDTSLVALNVSNGSVILTTSTPYSGRVSGQRSSTSPTRQAIFTLKDIRKDDGKLYACEIKTILPVTPAQLDAVRFVVEDKPKGVTVVINAVQIPALQGQNVTITCNVREANPPVSEFRFYFNDTLKSTRNNNHFTLTNVQRSQNYGKYKCGARNDVGEVQSGEVFLNINVPAQIISLTPNVTVIKTNPIDLRCDASGHPAPVIKWRKDGGPEQSTGSNRYRINSSKTSDSGAYVCIAENAVRRTEMKTFVTVHYAATIKSATTSTAKSWIGKTVSLRCVAEGVPTPTITWKKPSGEEINKVTTVHTADIVMKNDQDFGQYTCLATNGVGATATKTVKVQQIKAPDSPSITINIQATSITVNWTAPANNGGSPITAYRVVVLKGGTEIRNENITDRIQRTIFIGGLTKSTNYTVKVFARNFVFEGDATKRKIRTKFEGVPAAAEITDLPAETDKVDITLKWKEAKNNGASITKYTVYRRTLSEDGTAQEWVKIYVKDPSDREVVVTLQKGKVYEFVVTATNSFGEGGQQEEKIKKITVLGDVPSAVVFTYEIKDDEIILKWKEPDNNGAAITLYTVYKRIVNDEQWTKSGTIYVSKREYVVQVEKGKEYEFVVTATNKYGENSNKDNIKKVKVPGAGGKDPGTDATQSGGINTPVIAGAAAAGVLLIASLIIFVVWWKRKKTPRDVASSSGTALRNANEVEDGYQDISPAAAAQGLQASGPVVKPNYAQVDVSQKKKNRRPVTDDYAQVDKSKKNKKKPKKSPITAKIEADIQPSSSVPTVDGPTYAALVSSNYMQLLPSTRNWEVGREQVNIIGVIGKGAFSQVAQATVRNLRGGKENTTVAAKMLKENAPASDKKALLSELELMKKLKPHPHVIKLMGCVTESDPLLVLIEYVPFGDLLGYLRKSRGLNDKYFKDPDVKPQSSITAEQLMKFAWQVADGMFYLSSKKILHRDLAARNVLVGEGEKCKVTNFGMARNVQQDGIYNRMSSGRLPVKWTAYEALMYGTYTTQSDVWSYGVLLYEVFTVGGSPYPDINPYEIAGKLQEGYRMPKPSHVQGKLFQIMLSCWEENPLDRPTFDKLRKTMKKMERNHKAEVLNEDCLGN